MQSAGRAAPSLRGFPNLYNAKRPIAVSKGLGAAQLDFFRKNPLSETWREQVSKDVVEFVDSVERDASGNQVNELLPQEKIRLFRNPSRYFSRPHNVPESIRQQIYFPKFFVTLLRTPHLGPRYAQFKVPLWFSKLDLKSYLKNLYDVDANHIRSFVIHQKQTRVRGNSRYSQGPAVRPSFKKKMTVELVEPFIWPEEVSEADLNQDYDKKTFWESTQASIEASRKSSQIFDQRPDHKHRGSIAEQARDLLAGKATWQPTWQQLPQDVRVLQGRAKATALAQSRSGPPSPMS